MLTCVLNRQQVNVLLLRLPHMPAPQSPSHEVDLGVGDYQLPKEPFADKSSGVEHPAVLVPAGNARGLMVLGGGTRVKTIGPIKVKVYSVAMYVAPEEARKTMEEEYKGKVFWRYNLF